MDRQALVLYLENVRDLEVVENRIKHILSSEKYRYQRDINELREEMAWDAAEAEVKAQQDSIDEQITSIQDYMEYVENYYEDLFEHPTKLIEEMKELMGKTDEEIIEWLKTNSEEFMNATEASQTSMLNEWQDTLMEMRGEIELHWEEVEEIIAGGDDAIIAFLKENSKDYAEAGKLQAEAYVDQWKKQLEDLHKAYQAVDKIINPAKYDVIEPADSSGSGKSGSGGGGGKDPGAGNGATRYYLGWVQGKYTTGAISNHKDKSTISPQDAYEKAKSHFTNTGMIESYVDKTTTTTDKAQYDSWKVFKNGGLVDYTGPAWVDGSKGNPEGMLNAEQTSLFRSMVDSMVRMSRINVPSMPFFDSSVATGSNVSVGDIIVNVDSLDSDRDYEEVADKLMNTIMERLNRGAVVGGILMR